jgi:hypothetical protein
MHEFLSALEKTEGLEGLRAFHYECCADSPDLRARLKSEGVLKTVHLGLDAKLAKHFPNFS